MYNIEGERGGHEPSNILFKSSKRLLEKKKLLLKIDFKKKKFQK